MTNFWTAFGPWIFQNGSGKDNDEAQASQRVFIFGWIQTSEATHDRRELKTNQKNHGWEENG